MSKFLNGVRILRVVFAVIGIIIFIVFRKFESIEARNLSDNIASILRNEVYVANSYAISKSLVDLEKMRLFRCASLIEIGLERRVFYNTIGMQKCGSIFFGPFLQKQKMVGLNGLEYELIYLPTANKFAYFFETLIYLVILTLGIFIPNYIFEKIKMAKMRSQIVEIEKKNLTELAQQVSHDIMSPLTSIKMMTSLLKNVDPEVNQILNDSIKRTEEIVDELKFNRKLASNFSLERCIKTIFREKKNLWGEECILNFQCEIDESELIFGSEMQLKRVVSNLLNNAFEARGNHKKIRIDIGIKKVFDKFCVEIQDNGRGMPASMIKKLGMRGFTSGKEHSENAGSGLGVYYAFEVVREFNGQLKFESEIGRGTKAIMLLPPAAVIQSNLSYAES